MTIAEKITRAKADIDAVHGAGYDKGFYEGRNDGYGKAVDEVEISIKRAIEEKGVEVADGTPIWEYPPKIDAVYEAGKKSEYDTFWDNFQANGTRLNYNEGFAGYGWKDSTFKPKYSMKPTTAYMMFRDNLTTIDLVEYCNINGITIDFSDCTQADYIFYNSNFIHLGVIDLSAITDIRRLVGAFEYCDTKKVDLLVLPENITGTFSSTFSNWQALEDITIGSSICGGGANFKASTKLTKASITSIINALSTTTSGLAITLSKTAVNNDFETSQGLADGSTSEEWLTLIANKNNWTINLI